MKTAEEVLARARNERIDPRAKARVRKAIALSLAAGGVAATTAASAGGKGLTGVTIAKLLTAFALVASVSAGVVALNSALRSSPTAIAPPVTAPAVVAAPIAIQAPAAATPAIAAPVAPAPKRTPTKDTFSLEVAALDAARNDLLARRFADADAKAAAALSRYPRTTFRPDLLYVRAVVACANNAAKNPALDALPANLHARAIAECARVVEAK